jgi:hypothetical protein
LIDKALELVTGGTAGAAGVVGVVGVVVVVVVFGGVVVVVVVDEPEEGSSAEVPTVAGEVTVLDVEVDGVFAGAVAEVATDAGGVELEVVADVVPALVDPALLGAAAVVAAALAPVAEPVSAVEVPPQAVSAVMTAQQEIRRRGSILFRTMTPRRTARKFELCEMYSGPKNYGQHVSQHRLSCHATYADVLKVLILKR